MQFPKELLDHPAGSRTRSGSFRTNRSVVDKGRRHLGTVLISPEVVDALRYILPPRHPSQIYEACRRDAFLPDIGLSGRASRQPNGVLTGLFFIFYAIFRIVVEKFREPDATLIGRFTRGQFFSFFLFAIGLRSSSPQKGAQVTKEASRHSERVEESPP